MTTNNNQFNIPNFSTVEIGRRDEGSVTINYPLWLKERAVYQDTPTVIHLVIPANPTNEELSDSQLEMVAGGIAINPYIVSLIAVECKMQVIACAPPHE